MPSTKIEKSKTSIKNHLQTNKNIYIAVAITASVTAAITTIVMTRKMVINQNILALADEGLSVGINNGTLNQVSYIDALRQGPPSWVVRCLETGDVFTSQRAAAEAMNIPASELSKHLNGVMNSVRGLHFERLCMAA